jgi:hypothetical protein
MRLRWNDVPVGLRRARVVDTSAGAPGGRNQGAAKLMPQVSERHNGAAPTAGGVEEQEFDQARRRVRLRGVDADGEVYGAEVWLPTRQGGYGASPAQTSDVALLGKMQDRDAFSDCSGLAAWQRVNNRYYAK